MWSDVGVNGGDGSVSMIDSPLSRVALNLGQDMRAVWKYGEREMRMNRWDEKMAVVSLGFVDENLPERDMRTSE